MSELSIKTEGLSKQYRLGRFETGVQRLRRRVTSGERRGTTWALRDISVEISEGQTVALIGRNGAGKSTLLKVLARIVQPTEGWADVRGRVGALLEVGTGFHPELTGRENIFLNGTILGMRRSEIRAHFDEIVDFSGIGKYIDTPIKRYSSGMYIRLGFAVAAFLEPEILIVDEVLAVGDAEFQKRCVGRMTEVAKGGRTILFVSHNLQPVRALCERALLLESGRLVADDATDTIIRRYLSTIDAREGGLRRWEDPETRPGNDACRLVEVRIEGASGETSSTFFSSEALSVVFELDVRTPDPGLIVALDVLTPDGFTVFRSYSADGGAIGLGSRTGPVAARCTIPSGFLNGGRYLVNVRVHLRGIDGIVNEIGVLQFDVTADHGESYFVTPIHGRPGVVAPVLPWEVVEPGETGETPRVESSGAAVTGR